VLAWWKQHKQMLPVLFRLARKYLAIPATSIPTECVWSDAGNIVSSKRTQLTGERVGKLVFCYEGRRFL
jgi:hAT family C-terminal dimerisation region